MARETLTVLAGRSALAGRTAIVTGASGALRVGHHGGAHHHAVRRGARIVSKRALTAYADVLRLEYGTHLSVTTVYPGFVDTAIHERSRRARVALDGLVPAEHVRDTVLTVISAAVRLKRAGVHDIVLLERAEALGGIWRDNSYPRCRL